MLTANRTIAVFNGGYGRRGEIALLLPSPDGGTMCECDVCGRQDAPVLYIDGSEGEYSGGAICLTCATAAFEPPTFEAQLQAHINKWGDKMTSWLGDECYYIRRDLFGNRRMKETT